MYFLFSSNRYVIKEIIKFWKIDGAHGERRRPINISEKKSLYETSYASTLEYWFTSKAPAGLLSPYKVRDRWAVKWFLHPQGH